MGRRLAGLPPRGWGTGGRDQPAALCGDSHDGMGPEGSLGDLRVGRFPAGRDARLMSKTYPLQCVEDHGGRLAFLLADQETRKPGNQENREPRNLEIRKPRSQGTKKPRSQGAREPGSQGAREPGNGGSGGAGTV